MKSSGNRSLAAAIATLPLARYLAKYHSGILALVCMGLCLYLLLRALYSHLLQNPEGRSFLRKLPFLNIPEE